MSFPLGDLDQAFFDQVRTAAAGAPLRTYLGGVGKIIHGDELQLEARPAPPFVAFRALEMLTTDRIVKVPQYTWVLYDDPGYLYTRIGQAAPLLIQAYEGQRLPIASVPNAIAELQPIGRQRPDPTLGLLSRSFTWALWTV